jgi:hypothetical protein
VRFALLVIGFVGVLLLLGFLVDLRVRRRTSGLSDNDIAAGVRRVRGQADASGAGGEG